MENNNADKATVRIQTSTSSLCLSGMDSHKSMHLENNNK
jgi:hypothetical protein